MKLAFCLYKYFPFGGLQRDFLQIALACQAKGAQIRVYTRSWQGEKPADFEIILVPSQGWTNHSRNSHYQRWVMQHLHTHPVDCIVGFNKMPGLDIYYAADTCFADKLARSKMPLARWLPRNRHYAAFERAVFQQGSKTELLMLTERQIETFRYYYHTEGDRFHILPPGISSSRKAPDDIASVRKQFREQQQISEETFLLLQIGSDFKRKGVERSLAAIAALPENLRQKLLYIVIGQDKPARYLKRAKALNISGQVKFYAGRNDVPDFLFAADLLLHPAYSEAAGIVLLEAITAGLPVIVTDICGYGFHIGRANAGTVLDEPFQQ
ncbi:MAG: glycosyltransferase family 4 protein, partial [Enterobacteriaceae bacterium]